MSKYKHNPGEIKPREQMERAASAYNVCVKLSVYFAS